MSVVAVILGATAAAAAYGADTSRVEPADLGMGDRFGQSVGADGGTVVIGAPNHDHDATDAGAAYVFTRLGVLLPMQAELLPTDPQANAHFGASSAVSFDTIAIGAPDATGGGAVYVFQRTHGAWSQTAKLSGAAAGERLGASVAIEGNTIVAGVPGRNSSEGAVFVFVRNGTGWAQQAEITGASGAFGTSVDIRGPRIVVGAPDASSSRGVAAVYLRSGTTWTFEASIDPPDGADGDRAGIAVAIDDDWVAVGAANADPDATTDAGMVHVFRHNGGTWAHAATLLAPTPSAYAAFGSALSLDDGALVVGSPMLGGADRGGVDVFAANSSGWTYVSSIAAPDAADGDNLGAAAALSEGCVMAGVPGRDGGVAYAVWATAEHKVVAPDAASGDHLGWSVAIAGDTALVGTPADHDGGLDAGSVYVFTRSAGVWTQQQKLSSPDVAANGHFGWSVALAGDTALIGAPFDDDGSSSGRAYVFMRSDGVWTQQQRLTASDASADDRFGWSVALAGDKALIGAPFDDDHGDRSGSAYVFVRTDGVWTEQQEIAASDAAAGDYFGISVALDADTALVGADYKDNEGAAYVFVRSGDSWTQQQKLTGSDGSGEEYFGHAVALSGNTALVGEPTGGTSGVYSGKAYFFVRSGDVWTKQQELTSTDAAPDDTFGVSVAIRGDTAVIGAKGDDDNGSDSGSAYVFARSGGVWTQRQKFTPSDGASGDSHGFAVALSADTALVGAPYDDDGHPDSGSATFWRIETRPWGTGPKLLAEDANNYDNLGWSVAISGDTALVGARNDSDDANDAGSAYVFVRAAGVWTEQQKLTASDAAAGDHFGWAVALSGETAVVGAIYGEGAAADSGAAYVFVRSAGVWTQQEKLTASDGASGDHFGVSVALYGDTALVGAVGDDDGAGSAYAFVRSAGSWSLQQRLTADDRVSYDFFGVSVALHGDTALVGALNDDGAGSAYAFVRSDGSWSLQQRLTASDAASGDQFGCSVAISQDAAIVGAMADDDNGADSGSAYMFDRSAGTWTQKQKLTAVDGVSYDRFGWSVAIDGDVALVGAVFDDGKGSAYAFARTAIGWTQLPKLTASDSSLGDSFGWSVSLSGDTALVGAPQNDEKGIDAGAAYVFDFLDPLPVPFTALPGDLPAAWTIGMPLSAAGSVSGGTAPYQWMIETGGLPGGILLDAGTGTLSGTPDATGDFGYTIAAYDAWGATTATSDAITINPAPVVPAATLPAWTVTRPYSNAIAQTGGTAPIAWDVASGTIPPGMTLTLGGSLEGVPTTPGIYEFGARVTDAAGATATGTMSVTINALPVITTTSLPAWTEGRPYQQTLGRSDGTAPITWSIASGTLPVETPIGATSGTISGTALADGSYEFTAQITDAAGAIATKTFTVQINPTPTLDPANLPTCALGRPYQAGPDAAGGTHPFVWAITAGNVPAGLALDTSTGVLSGTPTGDGTTTLEFRLTDAAGATVTGSYPFVVVTLCDLSRGKAKDRFDIAAGQGGKDIVHFVELLGGTDVDLKLLMRTKSGASAELLLLDPDEQPIDLTQYTKTGKKSVTVKNFPVPATGRYFVVVRPAAGFVGSLKLTVMAAAEKTWKGEGVLDPAGAPIGIDFCALPGSKLTITTKASKRSSALPTITALVDEDGQDLFVPTDVRETAKGAELKAHTPLAGGDYHATISPRNTSLGNVEWTVKLRSPKGYVFGLPDVVAGAHDE